MKQTAPFYTLNIQESYEECEDDYEECDKGCSVKGQENM